MTEEATKKAAGAAEPAGVGLGANPVRRRKLYEEVAERIEELVRSGRFQAGSQLPPEKDLATELGVGRSAVREALLSLQKMGLVTVTSGERSRVTQPTPAALIRELSGAARMMLTDIAGIRQFQEARKLFEIGLARHAAVHATPADLAKLAAVLEENRQAIGNHARFRQTDIAFHFVLAEIPGNSIFTSLHQAMVEWLSEQRQISGQVARAGETAYAAHRRIFEAVEARDPVAAEQAMEDHLDTVARFYWQIRGYNEPPPITQPSPATGN